MPASRAAAANWGRFSFRPWRVSTIAAPDAVEVPCISAMTGRRPCASRLRRARGRGETGRSSFGRAVVLDVFVEAVEKVGEGGDVLVGPFGEYPLECVYRS
jgi:hypothetical protein